MGIFVAEGVGGVEVTFIEIDVGEDFVFVYIWVVVDKGRDEGWGFLGVGSFGFKLFLGRW